MDREENTTWISLSPMGRNTELYHHQVETLNTLLEHGAISQAQYDKSFYDLTVKMGISPSSVDEEHT